MESTIEGVRQETRIPMTYAEFLEKLDNTTHAEWVNGETIVFMPPDTRHQRVVGFLLSLLASFVGYFRLGEVLAAPYEMRISPDGNAREPDILFVASESRDRLTDQRLAGPADLVVEVISPESVGRDRAHKFYEYEHGGVREYWLIDPRPGSERADFWVLDASRRYRPVPPDAEGIYRSTVLPNFWFNTNWLWEEDQPDPVRKFVQIAGLTIGPAD